MTRWCLLAAPAGDLAPLAAPVLQRLARDIPLRPRLQTRSMLLLAETAMPVTVASNCMAAVLGHRFDASGVALNDAEAWIMASPEVFVRQGWGSYVAVRDTGEEIMLLRDPSGMMACYSARIGPLHAWFSSVDLIAGPGLVRPTIDWSMVRRSLEVHDQRDARTALREIDELPAGSVARVSVQGVCVRRAWQAAEHIAPIQENAPDALAQTVDRCMRAWGSIHRRPLIEISGGLDSAIVAASLAPCVERPALITFAPAEGDPVELDYARAVADRLGLPLDIATPAIGDVDLTLSLAAGLPRPNARAFTQAGDRHSHAFARAIGADAFASGGGGDDVFCYLRSVAPALDRLLTRGVGRGLLATIDDIAVMTGTTVWEVAGKLLTRWRQGSVRPPARLDRRFLLPSKEDFPIEPDAPRLAMLPGKAAHVRGVMTLPNHLEGHGRSAFAPILSPLLSQPIVEHCLSVPSWEWCAGGRNRAVARSAFASRLPTSVAERRSKGSFDSFCALLLDANRAVARELLLDGLLVRQNIADGPAIQRALSDPAPEAAAVMRLLALIDAETWSRSWEAQAARLAA